MLLFGDPVQCAPVATMAEMQSCRLGETEVVNFEVKHAYHVRAFLRTSSRVFGGSWIFSTFPLLEEVECGP